MVSQKKVRTLGGISVIRSVEGIWLNRERICFKRKDQFSFIRAQHDLSYHLIWVHWYFYQKNHFGIKMKIRMDVKSIRLAEFEAG